MTSSFLGTETPRHTIAYARRVDVTKTTNARFSAR